MGDGKREPIVLLDGKILDGRNRYRACQEISIDPITLDWSGEGSPLDYVVSMNLICRHLKDSQRAMVAAEHATLKRGEHGAQRDDAPIGASSRSARSVKEVAGLFNVSPQSVVRAKLIRREGTPQEIAAAKQDNAALSTVVRQIRARKKSPRPTAKAGKNPELYQKQSEAEKLWKALRVVCDLTGRCTKGALVEIMIGDDERTDSMNARLQKSVVWLQDLAYAWKSETSMRHDLLERTNRRKAKPWTDVEGTLADE